MSPFAVMWIAVDVAALVVMAAAFTRREQRTAPPLRPLPAAQMVVVASVIATLMAIAPLRAYAE